MVDRDYEDFERELKDLLVWHQNVSMDYARDIDKLRVPNTSINNVRSAIIQHCYKFDKKRKQHGIF